MYREMLTQTSVGDLKGKKTTGRAVSTRVNNSEIILIGQGMRVPTGSL
jgi:hypothetical protein